MRGIVVCGATAAMLLGSVAAFAQEPSLKEAQQQSFPAQQQEPAKDSPANTTPPPPLSQPQAPIADQAAPAAVGPAQANTTSGPTGEMVPLGATGQTMPSTISKENAALDKKPTTALQLPLSDAQKQLIAKSIGNAPAAQASPDFADVHVAMFLPIGVPIEAFSGDITQQVPEIQRYKYIKLSDRVLIVDPPILSVVGEIKL